MSNDEWQMSNVKPFAIRHLTFDILGTVTLTLSLEYREGGPNLCGSCPVLHRGRVLRDVLRDGIVLHQELAELFLLGQEKVNRLVELAGGEIYRPDQALGAGRDVEHVVAAIR